MLAAAKHKGASVVECLVNCVIFHDGAHGYISERATRADRVIHLEHGKKMIFGKDNDKGLVLDGFDLKVVTIGENGITEDDILVHDAKAKDPTMQLKLIHMEGPEFPIALGVFRDVEDEVFDELITDFIAKEQAKADIKSFDDLVNSLEQWEI